jgi:hypothetical protein
MCAGHGSVTGEHACREHRAVSLAAKRAPRTGSASRRRGCVREPLLRVFASQPNVPGVQTGSGVQRSTSVFALPTREHTRVCTGARSLRLREADRPGMTTATSPVSPARTPPLTVSTELLRRGPRRWASAATTKGEDHNGEFRLGRGDHRSGFGGSVAGLTTALGPPCRCPSRSGRRSRQRPAL